MGIVIGPPQMSDVVLFDLSEPGKREKRATEVSQRTLTALMAVGWSQWL